MKKTCQGVGVEVVVERWHGTIFSSRGRGWRCWWRGWHGTKPFFRSDTFFLIFNSKILPIWFSQVSRCHMKDFPSRILKQGLLFGICDFSIFKTYSEVVNISVGHPVDDQVFQQKIWALQNLNCHSGTWQKKNHRTITLHLSSMELGGADYCDCASKLTSC